MTFWHIALLGGLRAEQQDRTITRFRTRKTASLLAFLAYHKDRTHPREELAELFWHDSDPDAARVSLRTSLASLRRQLEPPGVAANSILTSDRANVGLNPSAVTTDVSQYWAAIRAADAARSGLDRQQLLGEAILIYGGALLPGFYDDWLLVERQRLEETYQAALNDLAEHAEMAGQMARALDLSLRAASSDPTNEAARHRVIRLYQAAGRPSAALRQYQDLAKLLRDELGVDPSPDIRATLSNVSPSEKLPMDRPDGAHTDVPHLLRPVLRTVEPNPAQSATVLPRPLTSFFGRDDQISRVVELIAPSATRQSPANAQPAVRLLTLTGPGGSGKTRAAIEAARRLTDFYNGAVWFVPLAEVGHSAAFLPAVCNSMRPLLPAVDDPLSEIGGMVGNQPALVVLDSIEHLLPEVVPAMEALLQRVPTLTCIVTSRVQAGIEGERVIPVPPLSAPAPAVHDPSELLDYPSVRLFVDRAQAARSDFQITESNAGAIASLCRRLEGLPLAIELAASWAQILTPAQMLERTESGLKSLSHRRKGVAWRHQSLAATAEWSFRLLDPGLQRLFACLSVFRGGWSAESAVAVYTGEGDCGEDEQKLPEDVLDGLARLAEASLIIPEERMTGNGATVRFRMLETLREFADEHLEEPDRSVVSRRHAECFRKTADDLDRGLDGPARLSSLQSFESDIDNLRAALEWSAVNDPALALQISMALYRFWDNRGYFREGRQWILTALESAKGTEEQHARALYLAGRLSWRLGDHANARRLVEESLTIWKEGEDERGSAGALNLLAVLLLDQGEIESARRTFERALARYRQAQDQAGAARVLHNLGHIEATHGDLPRGRTLLVQSILTAEAAGSVDARMTAMMSLAEVVAAQGDVEEARRIYTEVLEWARTGQDAHRSANALKGLARLEYIDGDYARARSMCLECMAAFEETGERAGVAACLSLLAQIAGARGNYRVARERLQQSLRLYLDLNQVAQQGIVVWCFACLAARERRFTDAARLMGVEEAVRDALGTTVQAAYRVEYRHFVEATREALGEAEFARGWEEGRAAPLDLVLRQLLIGGIVTPFPTNVEEHAPGRKTAQS